MTPEMKAAIMQMLQGGDSQPYVHPDAPQDREQTMQILEEKLAPAFEMIGKRFREQQCEIDDLKDIVYKMVTSFSDAVGGYKRQGMHSTIMGQYGPDLEALKPVYSDFKGSDIVEDLIDALMGQEGDPSEMAGQFVNAAKEKFGKYLGGAPAMGKEVSLEVSAEPSAEPSAEEDDAMQASKPDLGGESQDPAMKILNQVRSLRGARKTA
jgi:hypothetical protein